MRCRPSTFPQPAAANPTRHADTKGAALTLATPFDAARRSGDEQHGEHHQRRDEQREDKCPKNAYAAFDAAKLGENAKDLVDNEFEHGARSCWSTVDPSRSEGCSDRLAYALAHQEPATFVPVLFCRAGAAGEGSALSAAGACDPESAAAPAFFGCAEGAGEGSVL